MTGTHARLGAGLGRPVLGRGVVGGVMAASSSAAMPSHPVGVRRWVWSRMAAATGVGVDDLGGELIMWEWTRPASKGVERRVSLLIIERARSHHLRQVVALVEAATAWLASQGLDQWQRCGRTRNPD